MQVQSTNNLEFWAVVAKARKEQTPCPSRQVLAAGWKLEYVTKAGHFGWTVYRASTSVS